MSTARKPDAPPDPFRYGYRMTGLSGPDGAPDAARIPLTRRDLLHPKMDDKPLQRPSHSADVAYLLDVFGRRLAGRPDALLLDDCGVNLGVPGIKVVSPDVAIYFGADPNFDAGIVRLRDGGVRPYLMVEIVSAPTRRHDHVIKRGYYFRAGVPNYVIVDVRYPKTGRAVSIVGLQLGADAYELVPNDEAGRHWLGVPLSLWVGVANRRVVCYDGATGEPIPDSRALAVSEASAKARADAAEGEARTAIQARSAAEDEARAAIQAKDRAEAKLAELEAELRRLRGGG